MDKPSLRRAFSIKKKYIYLIKINKNMDSEKELAEDWHLDFKNLITGWAPKRVSSDPTKRRARILEAKKQKDYKPLFRI